MTRTMRLLRHRHRISYVELGEAAQISIQRLSQIELNPASSTEHHREKVLCAFEQVIANRKAAVAALEKDFSRYRERLLDTCTEEEFI